MTSYVPSDITFSSALQELARIATFMRKQQPPRAKAPSWELGMMSFVSLDKRDSATAQSAVRDFVRVHLDQICTPFFESDESEHVQDAFYKSGVCLSVPNAESTSIEVTELYNLAITQHSSAEVDDHLSNVLPLQVLVYLTALFCSVGDFTQEQRSVVERNLCDLCAAAEDVAPGTGLSGRPLVRQQQDSSSPLLGSPDMLSGLLSTLGTLSAAGNNASSPPIGNIIDVATMFVSNMMSGGDSEKASQIHKSLNGMKDVVEGIVSNISSQDDGNAEGPVDPSVLFQRIGTAFQSPDIQRKASESLKVFTEQSGSGPTKL